MQKLRERFDAGERVQVRGETWLIVGGEAFSECTLVTLRGAGEANLGEIARVLAPFDRITKLVPTGIARASRRAVLRQAARACARAHRWSESWTASAAKIELFAWQLEPALAAVSGATSLLLADEVGLGKTIQAALVLTELRARGLASRALVLTPASLRGQWATELSDRFGLEPVVFDHASLADVISELPVGANPWSTADLIVSSIDLVKRPEVRSALDGAPFDVLIVDEAHHASPGTDRGAVVADLASRMPWVVVVTATPHSGDERAYSFLRALGAAESSDEMIVFRRGRHTVGRESDRRSHYRAIEPTALERAVLDNTLAYARALWKLRTGSSHHAVLASVICRRATSSARALLRTLDRRRRLLAATTPAEPRQTDLPWLEDDRADDVEPDEALAGAALPDRTSEIEWMDRLIALGTRAARDQSKARTVRRLLRRTTEAAIVFSEYRDTISDLERHLRAHATLTLLHGGLSASERRESIQRFVTGDARVLLATDAAGEGLNLQARCRLVINMELPWNPLRLEQRIGRVDRLGQTKRVHAVHLFHRGSFEDEVLARLGQRIEKAARGLEQITVDERDVAAAILDGSPISGSCGLIWGRHPPVIATDASSAARQQRRARALAGDTHRSDGQPLCAPLLPRHRRARRFVLLFEWDMHDAAGRLTAREVLPLSLDLTASLFHADDSRAVARLLSSCQHVRDQLAQEISMRSNASAPVIHAASLALERRLQLLISQLEFSREVLFQGSLFDRRAEQQARANDMARDVWRAHLQRRLESIRTLRETVPSRPRLVACWPFDGAQVRPERTDLSTDSGSSRAQSRDE